MDERRLQDIEMRLNMHDTWISRAIGGMAVAVVFLGFFAYTYTDLKDSVNDKVGRDIVVQLDNHLDRLDKHLESVDDKILDIFRRLNHP